jgi:hypothetical protein
MQTCWLLLIVEFSISLQAATGMPPICFLSGLSGEELMMVVRAFPEAGTNLALSLGLRVIKVTR